MATRIIPGVSVRVVKDVVTPQLAPAGVLGLVGLVESGAEVARAASWSTFVSAFGPGSAHSLPDARLALENGVTELVVVPVQDPGAAAASAALFGANAGPVDPALFNLSARAPGTWANALSARVSWRRRAGAAIAFDLEVLDAANEVVERHPNLVSLPGLARNLASVLSAQSSRVVASGSPELSVHAATDQVLGAGESVALLSLGNVAALSFAADDPDKTTSITWVADSSAPRQVLQITVDGRMVLDKSYSLPDEMAALVADLDAAGEVSFGAFPAEGTTQLAGGLDASADALIAALQKLDDQGDVDLVLVCIQDQSDLKKRRIVYSSVIGHCERMADDACGRVGFGEVPRSASPADGASLAEGLVSDRFALVAPQGVLGAVAGRCGSLEYFESPTFKTLSGVGSLSKALGKEAQEHLLKGQVIPIAQERGRGIIVVRGVTTDGDQLSVRRVADRAVRGVKMIGDLFIGRLNNADGRAALKQKLCEMLLQMEREGALVPSTDGKDPAFKCDVYSTQSDFEKGIVRVEIAVRPVRAIDYIYATIRVQV